MKYKAVIDVETSGRSPWYHDMISLGLVIVNEDLNIIDRFYGLCSPWNPKSFNHETSAIHGFSLDYLMTQQSPKSLAVQALTFLNKYRNKERIEYMNIYHHSLNRFDFKFFDNFFLKTELEFSFRKMFHRDFQFSTIEMGRELGVMDNKLSSWATLLNINLDHHNALSDAEACAIILKHQMVEMKYMERIGKNEIC